MGFFNDLKEDLANTVNDITEQKVAEELAESQKSLKLDIETFEKEETSKKDNKSNLELEIQNILNGIENNTIEASDEYLKNEEEQYLEADEIDEILKEENEKAEVQTSNDENEEVLLENKGINLMINPTPVVEKEEIEDIEMDEEDFDTLLDIVEEAQMLEDMEETEQIEEDPVIITEGTTINGDIISSSIFDIRGSIKGNIDIKNNVIISGEVIGDIRAREVYVDGAIIRGNIICDQTVQISEKSVIIGELRAETAYVAGAVKGNIDITDSVVLDSSAKILGNINSKYVQINNGAILEGKCTQTYSDITPSAFFENF